MVRPRLHAGQLGPQADMVCLVSPENFVPADHSLRQIKPLADQARQGLSPKRDTVYAELGRPPSIPPEHLLKAKLL